MASYEEALSIYKKANKSMAIVKDLLEKKSRIAKQDYNKSKRDFSVLDGHLGNIARFITSNIFEKAVSCGEQALNLAEKIKNRLYKYDSPTSIRSQAISLINTLNTYDEQFKTITQAIVPTGLTNQELKVYQRILHDLAEFSDGYETVLSLFDVDNFIECVETGSRIGYLAYRLISLLKVCSFANKYIKASPINSFSVKQELDSLLIYLGYIDLKMRNLNELLTKRESLDIIIEQHQEQVNLRLPLIQELIPKDPKKATSLISETVEHIKIIDTLLDSLDCVFIEKQIPSSPRRILI